MRLIVQLVIATVPELLRRVLIHGVLPVAVVPWLTPRPLQVSHPSSSIVI